MSKGILTRGGLVAACAFLAMAAPNDAHAASIKSIGLEIGPILTDDDGAEATDISGVSCLPPDGDKHVCLVIDDQGRLAQAAVIEDSKLKGAGKIRLIGKDGAAHDVVGKAPEVDNCSDGAAKFKDLDGEAVAYYKQNFYVVGSHGCSRKSNKFRTSSFVLARVPDDVVAKAAIAGPKTLDEKGPIATSYRLSEALLVAPHAKEFFARDLTEKNGLNIEGLAIVEGKMYAGLRGPVIGKKAYLIEVDLDPLFDKDKPLSLGKEVREIELDFLEGRGIRDLAVLTDQGLVVLSGPAQNQDTSFALHAFDPKKGASKPIAVIDVPPDAKAEGLHVLAQEGKKISVVMVFDGPKSGGARRYDIELD